MFRDDYGGAPSRSRYVLPRRIQPYEGESLIGYIYRAADTYQLRAPMRLVKRLKPPKQLKQLQPYLRQEARAEPGTVWRSSSG